MHHAESFRTERVREARHHTVEVVHEIVARGIDVARVHANADARAKGNVYSTDDLGELLERGAKGRAGARGGLETECRRVRYGRETLADGVRVARDAGRTVVHVVPRMRDEELESERRAPTELARERLDGARA